MLEAIQIHRITAILLLYLGYIDTITIQHPYFVAQVSNITILNAYYTITHLNTLFITFFISFPIN